MQTILVTGGAGFIGGCFVRQVIAAGGVRVVNLDKLTYAGNLDSLAAVQGNPLHVFVPGDIGESVVVEELLDQYRPRAIVNFAAESHVDRSIDGPAAFIETNVVGAFRLLEATRRYWEKLGGPERDAFRFLQISTDEVYGSLGDTGRFRETTPYAPNSPYSASKAASDHLVRAYHQTYGLPTLTTHCSNNYGPFQFPEKLIPLTILHALEGAAIPVYGDGQHTRDWLYVEDHCRALLRVLENGRPGEVYNIGGGAERTNLETVRAVCEIVDRLRPGLPHAPSAKLITFVQDRPGHDRRYALDAGKIERELGWRPSEGFESGLESTVRWYLDNMAWVDRVTSGKHRSERLGLGSSPTPSAASGRS